MREPTAAQSPSFPALVQSFFTEYLVTQRAMSPRTIACYRDGLMLFLEFTSRQLGKLPSAVRLADIEPDLILAFLDHLEQHRHNSIRSRNLRLTALRTFLKFAGRRDVLSLHVVERALSIPLKRFEQPMLDFLTHEEMLAVLGSRVRAGYRNAITSCSRSCTTRGRGSQRSSVCESPTSSSTLPPACICAAKDASSAAYRCGRRR